ncbi:MAG: ribose-phosphate diphosphokinase [Gammaproteobacteria bacterium]|jgi:ribose-phosphate pyrophosphokinase
MSVILCFPEYQTQAQHLAEALSLPCHLIDIHHFPDSESRVTLPDLAFRHAIIYCGLEHPNNKLIELLLTVKTLRKSSCNRVSLVAPYLCYMRQDMAFHKGEAVSQDIIGKYLAELFENIITVDAHLHRTSSLQKVFPETNSVHISAARLFSHLLREKVTDALLMGPDEESEQWVKLIADNCKLDYAVARKVRHGDKQVSILIPDTDINFNNRHIVLIDDVISSGSTLINITKQLHTKNISQVDALVTHALFDTSTYNNLRQAGINEIWSSDSIPHSTNKVSVVPILAEQVKNWVS